MTLKNKPLAHLYRRFSFHKQEKGASLNRQTQAADEWCKSHGIELKKTYTDKGVSGFKGKNAQKGELSLVLEAIEEGIIKEGDYLLIENFDRLSREDIDVALDRFKSILRTGVNVVTLSDNKIYTKESVSNLGDILIALVIMSRANEESLIKSKRTQNNWKKKFELLKQGIMPRMRVSQWFKWEDGKYVLNQHAEAVKKIFELYSSGLGVALTAKEMNKLGYTSFKTGSPWSSTTILAIIKNPQACGTYRYEDEDYENMLPAVVTKEEFLFVQSELDRRKSKTTMNRPIANANLLTGIITCECGETMSMTGKDRVGRDGELLNYRYLQCSTYKKYADGCGQSPVRYKYIEALLAYMLSFANKLPSNSLGQIKIEELTKDLAVTKERLKETKRQIDVVIETLITVASSSLANKLEELEVAKADLVEKKNKIEIELNRAKIADSDTDVLSRLSKLAKDLENFEKREEIRRNIHRIVSEFTITKDHQVRAVISGNEICASSTKGMSYITVNGEVVDSVYLK